MILSVIVYRTPAQRLRAVCKAWTVGQGSRVLSSFEMDPQGPLTAREAAEIALDGLRPGLQRGAAQDHPLKRRGFVDVPLPGLEAL